MKKLIPVMLCLALLFGGIAGCATSKAVDPVDVTETEEKPYIIDFEFFTEKKDTTVYTCEDREHVTKLIHVHAIMSNEEVKCTNLLTFYDPDCNDYPLFQMTSGGPAFLEGFDSLADIRTRLMQEIHKQDG